MTVTDRRAAARATTRRVAGRPRRPQVQRLELPERTDPFAPRLGRSSDGPRPGHAWSDRYVRRLIALDAVAAVIAALIASAVRFGDDVTFHLWFVLLLPLAWIAAVALANGYERRVAGQAGDIEYRSGGRALLYLFAGLAMVDFSGPFELSRGYIAMALATLAVGAFTVRKVMRTRLARRRAAGACLLRTLVIGRSDSVAALTTSLGADRSLGLQPVAACAVDIEGRPLDAGRNLGGVPVVGTPLDAIRAVDLVEADAVAVASHPDLAGPALRRLAWAMEERGVELIVSPGLLDVAGPRMTIRPSTDLSLLHIERPAALRRTVLTKAAMDRVLAGLMLLVLAPVFAVIALLVKAEDRGPVFYRQQRVGVRGELFDMRKFRSMSVGADRMVQSLQDADEGNGVLFKMKNDPRVTRIGARLRRYSLDELPQLINVARGEMSLVGPRPPLPSEVLQYESDAIRRLHVRPGMTGLWQVSGRSDLSWEESLRLDLRYVDNWSPITDFWILLRTVRAVLQHRGAY